MRSIHFKFVSPIAVLIATLWCVPTYAVEGYFMEERTTGHIMGMTDISFTRYYNSPLGIRIENSVGNSLPDDITLLRTVDGPNNKKLLEFYQLNPANKTYMNHDFNTVMVIGYFSAMSECSDRGCQLKPDMFIDLGEVKTIKGHTARKMRLKAGGIFKGLESNVWNTKDWKALQEAIRTRWHLTIDMMERTENETGLDTKTLYKVIDQALEKYGAMMRSETIMSPQMTFVTEVTHVKKTSFDKSLFAIPSDYKKIKSFWPKDPGIPNFKMQ